MSSTNPQTSQPQPIPFNNQPIEQQQVPPSMDRFPSTSQFNQPLQQNYSFASINYGDQQNNQQIANEQIGQSGKSLNQPSIKQLQKQQQQQQVQELQKVKKDNNQIDQDEILRMFREQQEKKKAKRDEFTKEKKKSSVSAGLSTTKGDRKTSSGLQSSKKQQAQDQALTSKKREAPQDSLTALHRVTSFKDTGKITQTNSQYFLILSSQIIRDLVLQYKIQYRSSVFDPDWQKQRYKLREQFFQQLCIGIEEMRQKVLLSESQQQVLDKVREINESVTKQAYDFGMFKYCRNLVLETDIELFVHFHQRSKQPLSKDYKSQYKFLITNLKDPENYELRRKLLTHQFNADMIKVANEIQFFTDAKRNEIKEKQQKLLKQFSVDRESIMLKPEFQHEKQEQRLTQQIKYDSLGIGERKGSHAFNDNQPQVNANSQKSLTELQNVQEPFSISSLLSYNKYLDESTLTQFQELLSMDQIQKMKRRLDEDLRGECRERLLKKFQTQFTNVE